MSLRLLKISTYYKGFLDGYYNRFPHLKVLGYNEQFRHLMNQYFAWSDNYGFLLSQNGVETMEVVSNARYMQKAWAAEHGLKPTATNEETLMAQILKFKPDIIYFQDSITYNGSFVRQLRTMLPRLKLCVGNICAPFGTGQIDSFKAFDYFTVCSPFFKHLLARYGIASVVIPHAFDRRVLNALEPGNNYPPTKLLFSGSIFANEGFHGLRSVVLESLVQENIPFLFYGNLPDTSKISLFKKQLSFLGSRWLDSVGLKKITDSVPAIRKGRSHHSLPAGLKISRQLYKLTHPPLFGIEMFKALSRAEVGFNIHIDCAGDHAANMRMFETTGVGTCLLTDRKSDLNKYFTEDTEVVAYSSVDECLEKIRWLFDHPMECTAIAKNGQKKTLLHHNFESRVQLFHDYMIKKIK